VLNWKVPRGALKVDRSREFDKNWTLPAAALVLMVLMAAFRSFEVVTSIAWAARGQVAAIKPNAKKAKRGTKVFNLEWRENLTPRIEMGDETFLKDNVINNPPRIDTA